VCNQECQTAKLPNGDVIDCPNCPYDSKVEAMKRISVLVEEEIIVPAEEEGILLR
jgi:hypothetical protein